MTNLEPIEIPISSLPYFARCKRCIQRRLQLKHQLPVWMMTSNRTKDRRHWIGEIRGRELSGLGPEFPQGVLSVGGRGVRSVPLDVPQHDVQVVLTGTLTLFAAIDETASAVVYVDPPKPSLDGIKFRSPQLHGYRVAIANPSNPAKWPGHIRDLRAGIIAIHEGSQLLSPSSSPWLTPRPAWLESSWGDEELLDLLGVVLAVLRVDPSYRFPAGAECSWCKAESRAA